MTLHASIVDRAGDTFGDFLPQLGGALLLLVVGLLLARLVGWLVRRGLRAAGVDDLADRWKVNDTLGRAGLQRSLAGVAAAAVRLTLSVIVIFAAVMLLGLEPLSQSLNDALIFLPKLIAALAILLAGVVVAGLVRDRVDRLTYQMDFPIPLGQLAQVATLAIFAITAAAQMGVSTQLLVLVVGIVLAAVAAVFAIAFGLGGREMARALNAGRFVRAAFEIGETVQVGEWGGRILAIEPDATVLDTEKGRLRVPNHVLAESVVQIQGPAEGEDRAPTS
jgi:hypothetical protein